MATVLTLSDGTPIGTRADTSAIIKNPVDVVEEEGVLDFSDADNSALLPGLG